MTGRSVIFKAGTAIIALAGSVAPVLASGTDQLKVPVLGAPVTSEQQFTGKNFNFSPSDVAERDRMTDRRFNYHPELDALTVQPAK